MKKKRYIWYIFVYIEEINSNNRKQDHSAALSLLLDMSIFNDFVIKNDPVENAKSFFDFMEGVQLHHDQILVLEDKTFHCKVLSRQQI